jgi:hypothetical protein
MFDSTGLRSGIGYYTCQSGHRHAATSDCSDKWKVTEPLPDSTTRLPHGYVAGQKVPEFSMNILFLDSAAAIQKKDEKNA